MSEDKEKPERRRREKLRQKVLKRCVPIIKSFNFTPENAIAYGQ